MEKKKKKLRKTISQWLDGIHLMYGIGFFSLLAGAGLILAWILSAGKQPDRQEPQ